MGVGNDGLQRRSVEEAEELQNQCQRDFIHQHNPDVEDYFYEVTFMEQLKFFPMGAGETLNIDLVSRALAQLMKIVWLLCQMATRYSPLFLHRSIKARKCLSKALMEKM